MGANVSGLAGALYDGKKKQFLGRDGAGWGKLGVFYFFFYLGLAGFFCAMLAVFMALSPRDQPRYILHASRMRTRSNPLSPGLGFRPQPEVDKNLIYVHKNAAPSERSSLATSLDQYLRVFYSTEDPIAKKEVNEDDEEHGTKQNYPVENNSPKFQIANAGDCKNSSNYGYSIGQPCVLVKLNKLVGFTPKPGAHTDDKDDYRKYCDHVDGQVAIHCYGESSADADNIGPLMYYSESISSKKCGSLDVHRFPYSGKYDREDRYQAPFIWVQLTKPTPNVLINVLCRAYAQNIFFDKKTGRGLTRFQIFVEDLPFKLSSKQNDP